MKYVWIVEVVINGNRVIDSVWGDMVSAQIRGRQLRARKAIEYVHVTSWELRNSDDTILSDKQ